VVVRVVGDFRCTFIGVRILPQHFLERRNVVIDEKKFEARTASPVPALRNQTFAGRPTLTRLKVWASIQRHCGPSHNSVVGG
jgi:hypothetical protein